MLGQAGDGAMLPVFAAWMITQGHLLCRLRG